MSAHFTINAGVVTQQSIEPPQGGAHIKGDTKLFFFTFFANPTVLIIGSKTASC